MFGRPLGRDFVRPARYHDTAALLASSQSNVDDPVADRGDRHVRLLQPNAPVATLPEPVHSAHVTIIAESVPTPRPYSNGSRSWNPGSRSGADANLRRQERPPLVQDLQEFLDPFERLVVPVAGVDHAIAIARQRFRLGFAQSAGQERRRDGLRSDVESHDTPTLAIDPKLRRRKEIARRRRQPAETARGFFFQILQLVFAPTPGDASIASLN